MCSHNLCFERKKKIMKTFKLKIVIFTAITICSILHRCDIVMSTFSQLLGAAAVGIGVWAYVDKNKITVLAKVGADNTDFNIVGLLDSAVIVLVVGGAAILLIGFLGCCGAYKENQNLLRLVSIKM